MTMFKMIGRVIIARILSKYIVVSVQGIAYALVCLSIKVSMKVSNKIVLVIFARNALVTSVIFDLYYI